MDIKNVLKMHYTRRYIIFTIIFQLYLFHYLIFFLLSCKQVHKEHKGGDNQNSISNSHFVPHTTIPNIYKNASDNATISSPSYNNELSSSYDSILSSNDKLSDVGQNTDNWMYPNRRRGTKVAPTSFTDQLNQVLTEREQ